MADDAPVTDIGIGRPPKRIQRPEMSMNEDDVALIRAAFVALSGHEAGWLKEADSQKVLRALEARLEVADDEWLASWRQVAERGGSPSVMASAHGRTLERFNGFFTRLYLMAAETIEGVSAPAFGAAPEVREE